jgi:ADP-ribose pyrophosphatase YjhB (NUDIX family)
VSRIEHFNDPDAPPANSLIPAASTVVANDQGAILLIRRSDNQLWTIPGGAMEPGETIAQAAIRETKEETGLDVELDRLVGIYSNPRHVVEYSDGEVRQQFSVCFAAHVTGGAQATSDESLDVGFYSLDEIERMPVHDSIRLRIRDFNSRRPSPVIA